MAAEERYRAFLAELAESRGGKASRTEADQLDEEPIKDELALRRKTWEDARDFQLRLREAPRITNPSHASTNVVVVAKFLDDETVRKRGAPGETFLMGGVGESDFDNKLRTYSADSPIGMAVKKREVEDIVVVHSPEDGDYRVEILALIGLERFLESGISSFTDDDQLSLGLQAEA